MTTHAALLSFQSGSPELQSIGTAVWIIAIAVVLVVVALVAALVVLSIWGLRLQRRLDGICTSLETRTHPILEKTNALLTDLSPKIHTIGTNVEQMSYTVRARVDEVAATVTQLNRTVNDANLRSRQHIVRADAIVAEALVATAEISQTVQHSIRQPVRQVAGVVAGVQAALATFLARSPLGRKR